MLSQNRSSPDQCELLVPLFLHVLAGDGGSRAEPQQRLGVGSRTWSIEKEPILGSPGRVITPRLTSFAPVWVLGLWEAVQASSPRDTE